MKPLFELDDTQRADAERLAAAMTRNGIKVSIDEAVLMTNMSIFADKTLAHSPNLRTRLVLAVFDGKTALSQACLATLAKFAVRAHRSYEDVNLLALDLTETLVAVLANHKSKSPKHPRG